MSYRPLPQIDENLADLEAALRQERDPKRKRRLHLLVLIKARTVSSQKQAAEHLAVHRNAVSDWLGRYRQGGLAALLADKPSGKRPGQRTLPEPVFEALQERLATEEGFASYTAIQDWLYQHYHLKVPYKSIYNLVRYRLGAKLKVPRPEHPKKVAPRPLASPTDSAVVSRS